MVYRALVFSIPWRERIGAADSVRVAPLSVTTLNANLAAAVVADDDFRSLFGLALGPVHTAGALCM